MLTVSNETISFHMPITHHGKKKASCLLVCLIASISENQIFILTSKVSEKLTFLPSDKHKQLWVSGGKNVSYNKKFKYVSNAFTNFLGDLTYLMTLMFPLITKLYKFKNKKKQQNIKPSSAGIYLVKVNNKNTRMKHQIHQNDSNDVVLVSLTLTLNIFHTLFQCFYCYL